MKVMLFNIADLLMPEASFLSLSMGYLKSYFEKYSKLKDVEIKVIYNDLYGNLNRERPDVVGMSVASEFYNRAENITKTIKSLYPDTKIMIGGYHTTTLPESISNVFDFIVVGEGEQTFLEVIEAIHEQGRADKIKGLFGNPPRGLIKDLDTIPHPYRIKPRRIYANIITSRGCPFGCAFCSSSAFWKRTIRFHSAEYVIDDISKLVDSYGVRHITIWDDLFTGDIKRLLKISELVRKEKEFRKLTFGISARASIIVDHPEILEALKAMNVLRISIGFEFGSDRMLGKMKGKGASVENNRKAIELLRKYPFFVHGGFIIGSPHETEEDMLKTYEFMKKARLEGGYATIAIPYPGTEYWDYAKEKGLVSNDMDFAIMRTMPDFKKVRDEEFILLSDGITRDKFIELGTKIQNMMIWATIKSHFNLRKLNWKIFKMAFDDPMAFIPIDEIRAFFRNVLK